MFQRDIFSYSMLGKDQARRDSYLPKSAYQIRQMKRSNPYVVRTTKAERMAKIAANPKSLAYRQARQLVLYRSPMSTLGPIARQSIRTGGWANPSRGGEMKFVDTIVNTNVTHSVSTFGNGTLLNGLAVGSTASQRIGRKVTLKSLLIRYSFAVQNATTWATPLRILVVYDKQANATAPAITDILLTDNFNSQNNLSNRDRFVTLVDQITDNIGGGDNAANYVIADTLFKRINLETMFNDGNAGTIGDITSGSIYMFVAGTNRLNGADLLQDTKVRVRYTDV